MQSFVSTRSRTINKDGKILNKMEPIQIDRFLRQSQTVRNADLQEKDLQVRGISIDSRTLMPGDLFVAIRGQRFDGHDFVSIALEKGACAVVVEKTFAANIPAGALQIEVSDTTDFLMELAGWYRAQFSIPIIGLTGSVGKTTVKELLAGILSRRFRTEKTEQNRNNFIGVPLTLFQLNRSSEAAVVELGTNHPGEIARLSKIVAPTHALVTNIGSGHIGFFGSKEAIFREKKALPDAVVNGGTVYVNDQDPLLRNYQREGVRIKRIGLSENCDYRARLLGTDELGRVRFQINDEIEIQMQIPGRHHFLNGVLAAAIGLDLGLTQEEVKQGIESVQPVDKRMQVLKSGDIMFINDAYNANPESLRAAIDFLAELPVAPGRKRFLVVGDMLELGEQSELLHREIGQYLADKPVDFVFCYGEQAKFICREFDKISERNSHRWFGTQESLARELRRQAAPGDVVLIKGSRGMAMENVLQYLGIGE